MASTWIETDTFYRKLLSICRKIKLPTLPQKDQIDLFPKIGTNYRAFRLYGSNGAIHRRSVSSLKTIEPPQEISESEWANGTAAAASCQPFLAEYLADWTQKQPVLPDTYFIQRKVIESIQFVQHSDGSVEINIHNEGDQWPITRKYSVKQRFLVYRFLESCTKVFDQTSANITQDLGKDYDFEPTDKLTSLFKTKDASLEDELIGRTYYVLKYFVGMKGGRKQFYTHRTLSGNVDALRQDFIDGYTKGFGKQFSPQDYPRNRIQPVKPSTYDVVRKRHDAGTIRIHICGNIGVVESRPKGAKTKDTFPFCAVSEMDNFSCAVFSLKKIF